MLLPYNERAGPDASHAAAGNGSGQLLPEEARPTRLDKVFPDFATVPPNFPPLPHRRGSPSRGMHNDISAIKQLRLHALGSQMPFIHSARQSLFETKI